MRRLVEGRSLTLVRGTHYAGSFASMASQVYAEAEKAEINVRILKTALGMEVRPVVWANRQWVLGGTV